MDKRLLIGGLVALGAWILYERSKVTVASSTATPSALQKLLGINPAATGTGAQIGAAATGLGTLATDIGNIFEKSNSAPTIIGALPVTPDFGGVSEFNDLATLDM